MPSFVRARLVPGSAIFPPLPDAASSRSAGPSAGFRPALLWSAIGLSIAICAALMWKAGLRIDPLLPANLVYFAALLLLFAVRPALSRSGRRWAPGLADLTENVGLFMAMALTGAVATYPLAALSHGFADAPLQRIDEALHFHWLAWYETVAAHPGLQRLGVAAYQCIYVIPAALLIAFAIRGQRGEAHRFLASFWLAAILTLTLYLFMPAVGPLTYLWKGPIPYMPTSAIWQEQLIPALRAHQIGQVNLNELRGLVSAPSFHTASGVVYIATAWRCGNLRWPLTFLTLAMLLATPVEGTHYLSDMIIGAVVAIVALAAAGRLVGRFGGMSPV